MFLNFKTQPITKKPHPIHQALPACRKFSAGTPPSIFGITPPFCYLLSIQRKIIRIDFWAIRDIPRILPKTVMLYLLLKSSYQRKCIKGTKLKNFCALSMFLYFLYFQVKTLKMQTVFHFHFNNKVLMSYGFHQK